MHKEGSTHEFSVVNDGQRQLVDLLVVGTRAEETVHVRGYQGRVGHLAFNVDGVRFEKDAQNGYVGYNLSGRALTNE